MKKTLFFVVLSASPYCFAAPLIAFSASVGNWSAGIDGDIGTSDVPITASELGFDRKRLTTLVLDLSHDIPVLPNLRYTQLASNYEGSATATRDFTVFATSFTADQTINSHINLDFRELTIYFSPIDNWVNLDIGLTAREFDGLARFTRVEPDTPEDPINPVDGEEAIPTDESFVLNGALPMVYFSPSIDLPFSNWSINFDINHTGYKGHIASDRAITLGYLSEHTLKLGFELGYREMQFKIDGVNDLSADLLISGYFANLKMGF